MGGSREVVVGHDGCGWLGGSALTSLRVSGAMGSRCSRAVRAPGGFFALTLHISHKSCTVTRVVALIGRAKCDPRIVRMLEGYFLDMFLCLREANRVCRPGAPIAFVVGNAQYYGLPIPVDELTAEVGKQAGLECEKVLVARYRGNSAQQMGEYGRNPSRASIVIFRKPTN